MTQKQQTTTNVQESYAYCEQLAKAHYENFTVGSWLLPKAIRPSTFSLYAFCRTTDDLGDEAEGDRLTLLDNWEAELRLCYSGTPKHMIMVALQHTIQRHNIPPEPFLKLIEANRMDQHRMRYATFTDLLEYCDHSANPVGHMVLYVFGYSDKERQRLSDATCTALQLANFWQDVNRDYAKGRIYLPLEDMKQFGYAEQELASGTFTEQFRSLMEFEVSRAQSLFKEGLELVKLVKGELRLDLKLFSMGGLAVLDAIQTQNYDVLSARPIVSRLTKTRLALRTLAGLVTQRITGGLTGG